MTNTPIIGCDCQCKNLTGHSTLNKYILNFNFHLHSTLHLTCDDNQVKRKKSNVKIVKKYSIGREIPCGALCFTS